MFTETLERIFGDPKIPKPYLFLIAGIGIILGSILYTISFRMVAFFSLCFLGSLIFLIPVRWAILFLCFYIGFEGFAKIITGYNPIIHVGADLLIVSLWVRCAVRYMRGHLTIPTSLPPFSFLFLIHCIWFSITILNPHSLSLFASIAGAKLYLTIVSGYFFGYYLVKDVKSAQLFMIPWVIIAFIQSVASIYQSSVGPSSVLSLSPYYAMVLEKYRGYAFRPPGLTSLPGAPGIYVFISLSFILYFLVFSESFLISVFLLLLLPLGFGTLVFCQVRSAILRGMISSIGFLGLTLLHIRDFSSKKRKSIIAGTVIGVLILVLGTSRLLTQVTSSYKDNQRAIERSLSLFNYSSVSQARSGAWDRFVAYMEMIPFGAGLSRIGAAAGKFSALNEADRTFEYQFFSDNLWIELLVDLGIPGMVIFSTILFLIFFTGIRDYHLIQDGKVRGIYGAILCALIAIILGGYGSEPILYNPEGFFFWFFSGVLMRLPKI